jgi:hypothetical protein
MAYADLAALKARAGALARAWGESTSPSDTDLEMWLDEVAGEIDQIVAMHGYTTPVGEPAASALLDINASEALYRALLATFPSDSGPGAADGLLSRLSARLYGAHRGDTGLWGQLVSGSHPTLVALGVGVTTGLSSLATSEPAYPTWADWIHDYWYPVQAPVARRNMPF